MKTMMYELHIDLLVRNLINLRQLEFDDDMGENVEGIRWMSPIILSPNETKFASMDECYNCAIEFLLLLP